VGFEFADVAGDIGGGGAERVGCAGKAFLAYNFDKDFQRAQAVDACRGRLVAGPVVGGGM
jgi:hypothetical protein